MLYRYETHCHCSQCSACSRSTSRELVEAYHKAGFAGLVLTDHFIHGNTAVDRSQSWEDQMRCFYNAYLDAREAAKELDFDVIFGIEHAYGDGKEVLLYGIDLPFLLANPDIPRLTLDELTDRVHGYGGIVIQAHPYRQASYIDTIRLMPWHVDGVEAYNASNRDFDNEMAVHYAKMYNLPMYAASDNHSGKVRRLAGVEADRRYDSIVDMLKAAASHPEWLFCEPMPQIDVHVPGDDAK